MTQVCCEFSEILLYALPRKQVTRRKELQTLPGVPVQAWLSDLVPERDLIMKSIKESGDLLLLSIRELR